MWMFSAAQGFTATCGCCSLSVKTAKTDGLLSVYLYLVKVLPAWLHGPATGAEPSEQALHLERKRERQRAIHWHEHIHTYIHTYIGCLNACWHKCRHTSHIKTHTHTHAQPTSHVEQHSQLSASLQPGNLSGKRIQLKYTGRHADFTTGGLNGRMASLQPSLLIQQDPTHLFQ